MRMGFDLLRLVMGILVVTTTIASSDVQAEPAGDRPNVIFVITDDQGYGDLSCTGNPVLRTPNIDAFHDDAVRFTNFHVGPTCAPTRASLLTGHYSGSTGVWHTIGGRSLVREQEWMLPQAMATSGYKTAMFGKWHLGDNYPYRPQDRGFQTVVQHEGGGIGQQPDHWGNDYFDDTYLVNGEPKQFKGYCTDVWFDLAEQFIKENKDQPFFLYLAPNAPHSPYNVPDKYYQKYKGKIDDWVARFYGMIDHIDERFAQLRALLAELGLEENTILIFMTDNGSSCSLTDKQGFPREGFNAGLRGGKGSAYDGGHRVPFFIRWPKGGITGGRDIDTLTANIDFMPTIMDLCGVPRRINYDFHGTSLRPLLEGKTDGWPERKVVTESQRVPEPIKWRKSCVMTERWRLIEGKELYDILADPGQRVDVAKDHPDVVAELRQAYEQWYDLVYEGAEKPIPIAIGDPGCPTPTTLNSHDWRYPEAQGDVAWNQGQIRKGFFGTGYWEVDVKRAGRYRIDLRRWPIESGHRLGDAIEGDDIEWNRDETDPGYHHWYTGGNRLDIRSASLMVGDRTHTQAANPEESCVVFELDLPQGYTTMEARFVTGDSQEFGAYYAYITYLGE